MSKEGDKKFESMMDSSRRVMGYSYKCDLEIVPSNETIQIGSLQRIALSLEHIEEHLASIGRCLRKATDLQTSKDRRDERLIKEIEDMEETRTLEREIRREWRRILSPSVQRLVSRIDEQVPIPGNVNTYVFEACRKVLTTAALIEGADMRKMPKEGDLKKIEQYASTTDLSSIEWRRICSGKKTLEYLEKVCSQSQASDEGAKA